MDKVQENLISVESWLCSFRAGLGTSRSQTSGMGSMPAFSGQLDGGFELPK